jgi:hypothetical protein
MGKLADAISLAGGLALVTSSDARQLDMFALDRLR